MEASQLSASIAAGHEPSVFHARAVVVSLIVVFVMLTLSLTATWCLLEMLSGNSNASVALVDMENDQWDDVAEDDGTNVVRTLPKLSARQKKERLKYEAEQNALLTTYGWSDPQKTTARIPIDRAMELTVQRYGEQP